MSSSLKIPNLDDWGFLDSTNVDLVSAFNDYHGKSEDQIYQALCDYPIEMIDSLRWMPRGPFQYYTTLVSMLILSRDFPSGTAPDLASAFLRFIQSKVKESPASMDLIFEDIKKTLIFVSSQQDKFGAEKGIYSDFMEIVREIFAEWDRRTGMCE